MTRWNIVLREVSLFIYFVRYFLLLCTMNEVRFTNATFEHLIELYTAQECFWDSGNAYCIDQDLRQAVLNRMAGQLGQDVTGGKHARTLLSANSKSYINVN